MSTTIDSDFEHCNGELVYRRMIAIRDTLGELAQEFSEDTLPAGVARALGEKFDGDMTLFRFMDEKPGHHLVNGRAPGPGAGGPGRYFDGMAREGWHRLLRQLRNDSDEFWAGFHGEPA